jgi:hypothetical protein
MFFRLAGDELDMRAKGAAIRALSYHLDRGTNRQVLVLKTKSCVAVLTCSAHWKSSLTVGPSTFQDAISTLFGASGCLLHARWGRLARPSLWLGDFDARNRLGLLSYIAALAGGIDSRAAPPKLRSGTLRHDASLDLASVSSDRSTLRRRVAAWPQIRRNTVFSADCI